MTLLPLTPGLVHVWLVHPHELQAEFDRFSSTLSEDEHTRAAGYKLVAPRVQFILARGFLRQTLAAYLQVSPSSISFGTTGNEKPILIGNAGLHFNLSHTATAIALAVAGDREVGIDVEQIKSRRSLMNIAQHQFHKEEQADLERATEVDKLSTFYRIWTCKEAYLKGLGQGFALPLNSFAMRPEGDRYTPSPRLDNQEWSVISEIRSDFALAVAAPGQWQFADLTKNQ